MKTELIVACSLFVILVATIIGVSGEPDNDVEVFIPANLASYVPDAEFDGAVRPGLDTIGNTLSDHWNQSRAKGREFNRTARNVDYRARRELYHPQTRFDEYQPAPDVMFVGSFELERNGTTLRFPIIVDRAEDNVRIYARGVWYRFEDWVVSKKGVHL